ncbi:MAG TPA: FG-GAP-like repeat-containing protein, partial [Rhizobiaceae bacterium]|nr:FG-GAP-like repeat-containing protein [Rhizobiaceae bacterium]
MAINFNKPTDPIGDTGAFGTRLVHGDFDNDGDVDILYQNGNTPGVGIGYKENDGSGTFTDFADATVAGTPFTGFDFTGRQITTTAVFVADLDNDGDVDIVDRSNDSMQFWRNDNGDFNTVADPIGDIGAFDSRTVFGDFDNDGDLDILYQNGNTAGAGIGYKQNNGSGTFTDFADATVAGTPFAGFDFTGRQISTAAVFVADLDNDGDADIVDRANGSTQFWRNDGGDFNAVADPIGDTGPFDSRMALGDFDSDGDIDILYQNGNTAGAGIGYKQNHGDGTFTDFADATAAGTPFTGFDFTGRNVTTGATLVLDLDHDGDVDIIDRFDNLDTQYWAQGSTSGDGSPPTLVSSTPSDNATGVAAPASIVLVFDEPVVVGGGNLYIRRTSDDALIETIAAGARIAGSGTTTITVTVGAVLAPSTGYYLTFDEQMFLDFDGAIFGVLEGKERNAITDKNFLNFTTAAAAVDPTLDLDGDNSSGVAGSGYQATYTENGAGVAIVDTDVTITDDGATMQSATITLTNHQPGDVLTVNGAPPAGITANYNPLTGVLDISGTGTVAQYQALLQQILFSNSSDAPSTTDRTITMTVNDGTADSNVATATIHVTAVNDAPENTVPAAQSVDASTDLVFNAANGNLISISDVDAGTDPLTVTLSVASGGLTLAGIAGLTFSTGDGSDDATMTFTGSAVDINAALDGLTYRGGLGFTGPETLTITTNDQGNNGADPGLSGDGASEEDEDTVAITVNAVNEKPTIWFGDIITADIATGSVHVIRADGSVGFSDTPYPVVTGSPPVSVTALVTADFDGDGLLDVATTLDGSFGGPSSVGILYNNGAGGFDPVTLYPLPAGVAGPRSIVVADLNTDGRPDIVTANGDSNDISVLINGVGGIVSGGTFSAGANPYDLALGDVNGDGNADIVTANNGSNNVSLLLGNGDGTFDAPVTFAAGTSPASVALGDVNKDGEVDIVVANNGHNTISILHGDGLGNFTPGSTRVVGNGPAGVELGDLNGDGDLDIMAANFSDGTVSVLLSDGTGGFGPANTLPVGGLLGSPILADVDGDGHLDIVAGTIVGFPPAGGVLVLFGDGAGGFARSSTAPTGMFPVGVATGHFGSTTIEEDATLTFAVANGNGIVLTDSDSAGGDETLTLSVAHGALTLASVAGLTSVAGNGTGAVMLTGSIDELNAALNGLVYTPAAEFSGTDTLNINLNDNGNSGGPAATAARTIAINVNLVNDVPTALSFANRAAFAENSSTAVARKVADIVVADPDGGNTLSLSGADAHLFQIVGTELRLRAGVTLDFETDARFDVIVNADDPLTAGAPDVSTALTLNVTDVNERPSLALTNRLVSLSENASTATARKVANIVITDDALGSEKLTLTGADASLFQIVGTELRLKAGVKLDFETNPKLDVKVVLNDLALPGIEDQMAMAIRIVNGDETITGTPRNDRLTGTAAADRINGLAGNDTINGGGGNDTITGGIGVDVMTGGAGADTFVFLSFRDSAPNQPGVVGNGGFVADQGLGKRDIITDFVSGVDRID